MKRFFKKLCSGIPLFAAVFFGIFLLSLAADGLYKVSLPFANAVHDTVGNFLLMVLASLTSWIPFSLAECLLILSPILVGMICYFMVRRLRRSVLEGVRYFTGFLSIVCLVFSILMLGYNSGYYCDSVEEKVGIERKDLSPEELYETAHLLIEDIKEDISHVYYPKDTYSAMRFSYAQMNDKLNRAYATLSEKYPAFPNFESDTKPVMLSEPWTYTHISGVYSFFTGEANVNTNYPDFIVVSSAAHEMAHQRGITKEDEANFIAFLVCTLSDDPYIRYCGRADALNDIMTKLSSASPDLWAKARAEMPIELKREYADYSEFFDQYRENVAATVSTAVNNAYITSHNQPAGVKSYGLAVDLVAAYVLHSEH